MAGWNPRERTNDRLVTLAVAVTAVLVTTALWFFNQAARDYQFYLVGNLLLLFFVPALTLLLLGRDLAEFGFCTGDSRRMRWVVVLLFAGLVLSFVLASRMHSLQEYYRRLMSWRSLYVQDLTGSSWLGLAYAWISYGMYLFFWEFFFRGYLLFGLARTVGWAAIVLQAIPFCLLHWQKVPLETALSFPAGIILGILAHRARSFMPCFALHWAASVAFDVMVLLGRR